MTGVKEFVLFCVFPPCRCPYPPAHVSGPGHGFVSVPGCGSLAAEPSHPEPLSPSGGPDAAEAEPSWSDGRPGDRGREEGGMNGQNN